MREIIGMSQSVAGTVLTLPGIFSVLFQYNGFPVSYESDMTNVLTFDAHIEVYSSDKVVRVQYDMPCVKGLPVTMTIRERVGDRFQKRILRKTYTDPYMFEFLEFHDCAAKGKTPKTTVDDARRDVELFRMVLRTGAGRYK